MSTSSVTFKPFEEMSGPAGTDLYSQFHRLSSSRNADEGELDLDYFLDQSSVTFTEDFSSSLISGSVVTDASALDTLTPSQISLCDPADTMTYNKKSYHKCSAENRDPRCVCSAKLGLDFPTPDSDDVFDLDEAFASSETSKPLNDQLLTQSTSWKIHNRSHECADVMELCPHFDCDDCHKELEETASSLEARSSVSSIDSDFLESKEVARTQCATDSGVGSSRSGKHDCVDLEGEHSSSVPLTPKELCSSDLFCPFSPKSSCDSEPEESNSQHGTYRSKRRTLSDSESSLSTNYSSTGSPNEWVAECERFMRTTTTKIFNPG